MSRKKDVIKEVKKRLNELGAKDIPSDEEIEAFVESGMGVDEIVEIYKPAVEEGEKKQEEIKPSSVLNVGVSSDVKRAVQKAVSSASKDIVQRVLEQVPPKAKLRLFIWDEKANTWAYLDTIPGDIVENTDIHEFLKKRYARYNGINKFKIEIIDAANNILAQTETNVYASNVLVDGRGNPIIIPESGDKDTINIIRSMFEKMEQEKNKLYEQMMELQKQVAQRELEQAQKTMEILRDQLKVIEDTYRKRIEELQSLATSSDKSDEIKMLVTQITSTFESQVNDLKNIVVGLIDSVKSVISSDNKKEDASWVSLLTPIIQASIQQLQKKDDSFEKMMNMIEFIDRLRRGRGEGEKEEKVDVLSQLKAIVEVVNSLNRRETEKVDPVTQFQSLLTLVKEMLPKDKDTSQQVKEFIELFKMIMPKEKDPLQELQKIQNVLDILGIKKNNEEVFAGLIKELKEGQDKLVQQLQQQQQKILELMINENKSDSRIMEVIEAITRKQEEQQAQMQQQMMLMMDRFRETVETVLKVNQIQQPQQPQQDPISALLDNVQKIEQLKRALGTSEGKGGGFLEKLIDGITNVLPTILQASLQQQQQIGYAGYPPVIRRVVRKTGGGIPRRIVKRGSIVRKRAVSQTSSSPQVLHSRTLA
jgi:hypothetical protein